ncbi:unnamed protein product [Nezara viridula]|uniref:Condensin complex subunit 1 n=1 Tax=Nezara viridula TaxID=85310 RepID=A0A9P0HJH4_NEZVI|nr:unnamed protein product [Nezara viridula]
MDVEFVIPLKKEDLLKPTDGQYCVELLDLNEAYKKIRDIRKDFANRGCSCITENFDVIFSLLQDSQEVSFNQLQELWDSVIFIIIEDLRRFVTESLQSGDSSLHQSKLNLLKMNMYIISLFIKTYEEKLCYQSDNFIVDKKGKASKSKAKVSKYETPWDWNSIKKTAFTSLSGVLEEDLHQFWDPPVVEEKFVNLLANCCYKAYENAEITQAKMKPVRDAAAQILAVLVNRYNHGMTFIPKCVQLLKQYEHAVSALSSAVLVMVIDFKCTSLLAKVLNELITTIRDDDVQGMGKAVAAFINSISDSNPELLIPSINILTSCLAFEPYVLRNAVLVTFADIILKRLSSDDLPEDEKKIRSNLLKYLLNHLRDQSSYVRSKALQLWSKLASEHAIPKITLMPVLRTAKSRLTDGSSHVVKSAIQFFKTILKDNPYAGMFNLSDMRNQLAKAKENLKAMEAKEVHSKEVLWSLIEPDLVIQLNVQLESDKEIESVPESDGVSVEDTMIIIARLLQNRHFSDAFTLLRICEVQFPNAKEIRCNVDRSDLVEYYIASLKKIFFTCTDNFNPQMEENDQQKLMIQYMEDAIAFVLLMAEASKDVELSLYSSSTMEATEAIEFFTTAYQFNAADSRRVIRQMILLIWSKVPGLKEAIIGAYKTLYVISNKPSAKGRAMQVSNRLIKLLKEADNEQKSAMEELFRIWYQNGDLDKEFIQVLWEKFSKMYPQTTDEDSVAAIMILDMIAEKNPQLVMLNLHILIENGLSDSKNLMLVENVCKMISKISDVKVENKYTRLHSDHEVFSKASDIIISKFLDTSSKGFIPMATSVVKMIFKLCCYPVKIMDSVMEKLYKIFVEESDKGKGETEKEGIAYNEHLLGNLLHLYGESMFRKWQYFDRDVFNSLKKDVNVQSQGNESMSLEDELDTENKEAANDALLNSVNEICENLLFLESSLDSHLRELVVKICFGLECSVSKKLATIAASTLAKLMMISHSFCENNMQVFVTIMEKSPEETVRANVVMGFGDIINRWPNIADPWTSHLYGRLKDSSVLVRSNTVTVLSHLITREMIKVRGQIAELCLCLEDPEPHISDRVRYLLISLSQKGNTLYNVVPDIISRLSNPDRDEKIPTSSFNRILSFVLSLLGKERQNDLLVEKLCSRLQESNDEAQWRQLSFCLLQLNYSEKSLKKLIDSIPMLHERLLCSEVYSALQSIFNTALKSHFTKPQLKELATEGHSLLEEILMGKDGTQKKNDDDTFIEPKTPRIPPPRSERRVRSSAKKTEPSTPRTSRLRTPRARKL